MAKSQLKEQQSRNLSEVETGWPLSIVKQSYKVHKKKINLRSNIVRSTFSSIDLFCLSR